MTQVYPSAARYSKSLKGRFNYLKQAARKRKIPLELTLEEYAEIVEENTCYYCGGSLPTWGYGLDRIHNEKGYSALNVRPCCRQCNVAKNKYSESEFFAWFFKVAKQRGLHF